MNTIITMFPYKEIALCLMDNKYITQNHIGTISLMGFCYDFHRQLRSEFR